MMKRIAIGIMTVAMMCTSSTSMAGEAEEEGSPGLVSGLLTAGLVVATVPFAAIGTLSCALYHWESSCFVDVKNDLTGDATRQLFETMSRVTD
ncbi:MAG: hypothetical protein ABGX04_10215 [Myxococcales bacterium]|jgi:hypothetical protein|nr:hypothetical protein [Myxococcales bacterium]HIK85954.1 hypothetical protein [Myxococcales bacterium]